MTPPPLSDITIDPDEIDALTRISLEELKQKNQLNS